MQYLITDFHKLASEYEMRFNHLVPMQILKYTPEESLIDILKAGSIRRWEPVEEWKENVVRQDPDDIRPTEQVNYIPIGDLSPKSDGTFDGAPRIKPEYLKIHKKILINLPMIWSSLQNKKIYL